MKEHIREDPKIVAAAERQMRQWTMNQAIADESTLSRRWDRPHRQLGDYITLSRETGAGGSEVAAQLGEKLGWEVLDKKLLDQVADRSHLPRPMLEIVDETAANWAYDIFGPWLDHQIIPHQKYVVHLGRTILAAVRRGKVVLVGRGAQYLLPRDQGMAVRLIASEKFRVDRLMKVYGFTEPQAREYMGRMDRGRREFVMRYFRHDISDPHAFDLVVQVDRIGIAGAAELIAETYRRWYARPATG